MADDGVTYLWPRLSNTFDKNACKFDKPDFLPCPKGTAPCSSKPGVCWDPERKIMATTISPYDFDIYKKPMFMTLLQPQYFTYNENTNNHIYYDYTLFSNKKLLDEINKKLQRWVPDNQINNPKIASQTKVYEQFKSAAAIIMKYLDVGESHNVFILSLPNEISWKLQRGAKTAVDGYFNINGQSSKGITSITIDEAYDINDNSIRQITVKLEARGDTIHQVSPIPDSRRDYSYSFNKYKNFKTTSNNSNFTVTKINNTTADCVLKNVDNSVSLEAKYTFDTYSKVDMGFCKRWLYSYVEKTRWL